MSDEQRSDEARHQHPLPEQVYSSFAAGRSPDQQATLSISSISSISGAQEKLLQFSGLTFADPGLLACALTHRSFLNEHPEHAPGLPSNERLEFLGDAVLNFLTASWLYQYFPNRSEGELTALRAALVRSSTLARFARELDLGSHIRVSRGEARNAARERPALLADTFEALLGAIYLDQGIDAAAAFVIPFLRQEVERIAAGQGDHDYRTQLQEQIQALYGITPTYRTMKVSGPDHSRKFTVAVLRGEKQMGVGSGSSKQIAAQEAARQAIQTLQQPDKSDTDTTDEAAGETES